MNTKPTLLAFLCNSRWECGNTDSTQSLQDSITYRRSRDMLLHRRNQGGSFMEMEDRLHRDGNGTYVGSVKPRRTVMQVLNQNFCPRRWQNLFSVFEISLCVGLSGTFLLISTSIVGDISRYIDTAYYLGYTNCPSIHVRSYTDLSLTIYFSHFYYPPKQPLSTQPLSLL